MRCVIGTVALAGLLLSAAPARSQGAVLDAMVRDPARWDHRVVVVSGTVGFVQGPQSFTLMDAGASIRVVGSGGTAVRPGDRVEVEGTFNFGAGQIEALRITLR